jgi:hypothetical protein
MHDQPRYKPYAPSAFFADGLSARPIDPRTVARGDLREDDLLYHGKIGGKDADVFPFAVTREVLNRGRERYNIFCSPCHGRAGDGAGMIPQRGFRHPPSFHIARLREAPAGHFVDVIEAGFGAMMDHAARVRPRDRWAIAAYIRTLQFSQNATLADVPEGERPQLMGEAK